MPQNESDQPTHWPARVAKQSLLLVNIGTDYNWIPRRITNWNTFLSLRTVLITCFVASFFSRQHNTPFCDFPYYFLSDRDINRQVNNIHKETIVQAS